MKKLVVRFKDCVVSCFSGSGAGGQHRNKHMNCVRLFHPQSGVRITSQDHKEKPANEREAMKRLSEHPRFKAWAYGQIHEQRTKEEIEALVEEQMNEKYLEWKSL